MANSMFRAYFYAVAMVFVPLLVNAQANSSEDSARIQEVVVVTGTSVDRTGFETPLAVSQVSENLLRRYTGFGSQADVLQQVPGLKVEGGGGEVATNFRVRGLPSSGQFEFSPLNYDGVTVLSSFGLNSSAFDFFARNDLGIERLEFVKGGVSNLFGVSSTAGIINYVSKTGTEEDHGTLQLEVAEDDRYRSDFAFQGPISDNTYYAVSGFYRYDEGPLDTGMPTEGFALRGNIKREFEDGSGNFTIYGSYINDRVNFYLPLPLDGSSRERVNGNDGEDVFTTNSSAIEGLRVQTPEGITEFRAADGFKTVGGSIYAILDKDLGNDWVINAKVKYSSYDSSSNFFNNGLAPSVPQTQAQFLERIKQIYDDEAGNSGASPARVLDITSAVFTDVESGNELPADALLYHNGFNDRQRPTTDGTIELNLTRYLDIGSITHNLTLGMFVARAEAENNQRSLQYLSQFVDNPTLVDLEIGGNFYTSGGLTKAVSAYNQQKRSAFKRAIYIADQMEIDRWVFDIGARIEKITIRNRFETTETIPGTLLSEDEAIDGVVPIKTQVFGTGQFLDGDAEATGWALAAGVLYDFSDNVNLYANASRGFFFPQAQGTGGQISRTGDIQVFDEEPVYQLEGGVKYRNGRLDSYAAMFYTGLRDRNSVVFVGDNLTPEVTATETDTFGIELNGTYDITDTLAITANAIYQNAEYINGPLDGNQLNRLPDFVSNIGLLYDDGNIDAMLFWNYQSEAFQDGSNNVPLDAYNIVRVEAGYTFDLAADDSFRFSLAVWNLFDSEGLAEGNPRAGLVQVAPGADAPFFNGRPILPRRVVARLVYDF